MRFTPLGSPPDLSRRVLRTWYISPHRIAMPRPAQTEGHALTLILVKRGKHRVFGMLSDWLREERDVQVIWDRRVGGDRRKQTIAVTERRTAERRRGPDPHGNVFIPGARDSWSVLWYVAVKVTAGHFAPGQ